jgi:EmrB/QacA subfamily drug resistance transporter
VTAVAILQATSRPPGTPPHRVRSWWVLAVLSGAQLMLALDATVVNIALPRAQAALGFSDADRQWIVTAYSLAFGGLLLLGGRLADLFGRRRLFLIGLVGFACASAIGGLARTLADLVVARALQGGFGAMLAPAALSLLTLSFTEPADRARAFGCFAAVSSAGGSVGLVLGGLLTEYVGWRWVMYVNVVIAVVVVLAAWPLLPTDRSNRHRSLDVPGALLAVTGGFTVVYGFSRAAAASGLSGVASWWWLGAGPVLLAAFVLVERRAPEPLLPLRIVFDRDRGGATAAMFLSATGVFGILLFLTYYLERIQRYSPVETGLAFLPMTVTMIAVGGLGTAAVSARLGPQRMVPLALLTAGVGTAMLARIGVESHYAVTVLPATVMTGLGLGLLFAPCFDLGTAGIDEADTGTASATLHVAQQLGGSIGMVLLNAVATTVAAGHVEASTPTVVVSHAAVHSYSVVFGAVSLTFGAAAVVVGALLTGRRGRAPVG